MVYTAEQLGLGSLAEPGLLLQLQPINALTRSPNSVISSGLFRPEPESSDLRASPYLQAALTLGDPLRVGVLTQPVLDILSQSGVRVSGVLRVINDKPRVYGLTAKRSDCATFLDSCSEVLAREFDRRYESFDGRVPDSRVDPMENPLSRTRMEFLAQYISECATDSSRRLEGYVREYALSYKWSNVDEHWLMIRARRDPRIVYSGEIEITEFMIRLGNYL